MSGQALDRPPSYPFTLRLPVMYYISNCIFNNKLQLIVHNNVKAEFYILYTATANHNCKREKITHNKICKSWC